MGQGTNFYWIINSYKTSLDFFYNFLCIFCWKKRVNNMYTCYTRWFTRGKMYSNGTKHWYVLSFQFFISCLFIYQKNSKKTPMRFYWTMKAPSRTKLLHAHVNSFLKIWTLFPIFIDFWKHEDSLMNCSFAHKLQCSERVGFFNVILLWNDDLGNS